VSESLSAQAENAIGLVVEGECPLCRVELPVHDDRACCGDSYRVATDRLDFRQCH